MLMGKLREINELNRRNSKKKMVKQKMNDTLGYKGRWKRHATRYLWHSLKGHIKLKGYVSKEACGQTKHRVNQCQTY